MSLNKILLSFCTLLLVLTTLRAQSPAAPADSTAETAPIKPFVEYVNGGKRINVQELGFSPNMTVWELLQLLPELYTRGSLDVLNNYTIIMDDYSLGVNRDAVLYQMTIGELEAIVISNNPSMAYSTDGVGGSIELIPRKLKDNLSGNAQIDVATEQNVLLSTNVNYKREKWKIRSYLKAEYANYTDRYDFDVLYGPDLVNLYGYECHSVSATQIAKFSIDYEPTEKDELSFSIWETYGQQLESDFYKINTTQTGYNYDTSRTNGVGTFAHFQYAHKFTPDHKLTYNVDYQYSHKIVNGSYSDPHELNSGIRYQGTMLQKQQHKLVLLAGGDFAYSHLNTGKRPEPFDNFYHFSPLLELRYSIGSQLYARVGARYHYDQYDACSGDEHRAYHDYTMNGEVNYTFAPGHSFRLTAARYRLATAAEKKGSVASGDISYMFQKTVKTHYFHASAGLQYNCARLVDGSHFNIIATNASAVWQHKWFCLSFSGQLFDNITERSAITDYHLYCNFRLIPIFTLPKGWMISANFMYNSKIMSKYITYGDYFYASLRVGKRIKQWSIHLELSDPFHYQTRDKYYIDDELLTSNLILVSQSNYHPYHRYLNLGVMYNF